MTEPLAHALLRALKAYGAGEIFGIPGDFALPFFREIEASAILPLYTLSHEPGVGFAADAAARWRGSLGVAAITYGAGGLNMVNPVAQAYAEKSPVAVISGAPGAAERRLGLGLHHMVKHFDSQRLVFREVTVADCVLDDPATAPAEIARVLTAARLHARPVYIELPRDMVGVPVAPVPPFAPPAPDMDRARAAARAALAALKAAERPCLMLDVEVRRFGLEAEAAELARRLAIPTTLTFMGRGLLADETGPLIGPYFGLAGDPAVRDAVEGADCLLMLGVLLCDTNFGVSARLIDSRRMILAADREVRFPTHVYPEVALGDLIAAMLEEADPIGRVAPTRQPSAPRGFVRDESAITPGDVARAVNELFDLKGRMPIASDMGDCLFATIEMAETQLVAPAYYATMGAGVPMGLGLEAASGRRPLILVGDGAFQMTGWELGNARRLGLKPVVLVFNNLAWGMLKVFQPETRYNDLDDWRFAEMAPLLGGKGRRVATRAALWDALIEAVEDESGWRLVEMMIPPGVYSPTLERFVGLVKAKTMPGATPDPG
jgi:indolepyruvate decarboxylase